jgi:small conductance mechanosensitive channel
MDTTLNKVIDYLIPYAFNIVAALLIVLVGKWVARVATNFFEGALKRAKVEPTLASFGKNIAYFSILTFVVIAALNKLGVETNSFLAIIGAAGLAVGLALQGSLSNFAAGVMMIIFNPFKLGDHIEAGGAEGVVTDIQIFHTVLMTPDKKRVIIPNAKITADKIVVHPKG